MSINNSYFSKNDTIIYRSYVNTGRNPVTELFYGSTTISQYPEGFSRFIFDLDLSLLKEKVSDGTVSLDCSGSVTHTLRMTNTGFFGGETLLNQNTSQNRKRATSFDLILFRIPMNQMWDEGVGYDYADLVYEFSEFDSTYSIRPSNWYQRTTINLWDEPGLYNNKNQGSINYNDLTIIDIQHFQFGNENISFDMTNEINSILNGSLTGVSGWGIAYKPEIENLAGLTDAYETQFFTRHTQTFYEPFLESNYDDLIQDNRNEFVLGKVNKLYLYLFDNGNPINLDFNPNVTILDQSGRSIAGLTGLTSCRRTKGVYEITIPPLAGYKTPCMFTDKWTNLILNGFNIGDVTNNFSVYPMKKSIQIGPTSQNPKLYGFDFYGLKQDEKIYNTDVRKVGVIIKQAYTTQKLLPNVDAFYRVYVREGQTEVQVQDWTQLNRTPTEYYFIFDTRDKIPNEYYIDMKVESSGEINTYKRTIKFQIVNLKYFEDL